MQRPASCLLFCLVVIGAHHALPGESQAQEHLATLPSSDGAGPADEKPLWEWVLVGGGAYTPDYPAAEENSFIGLVFPYFIYRGDILRVGDREIVRGRVINTDRIEFDVGLDGAFAVDSDENEAREGMPDLDYLGEIGPQIIVKLSPANQPDQVKMRLQVRGVFSTDLSSVAYRGIVVNPSLSYENERFLNSGVSFNANLGSLFGYDDLNGYFYEVQPEFARPGRPAFEAREGYIGTELTMDAQYYLTERLRVSGAVRVGYFGGSANEDSPLYRDDVNFSVGIGFTWSFFQSSKRGRE